MARQKVQLDLDEAIRLYNDKSISFNEKAKLLGTSPDTFRNFLRDNGVDIPARSGSASSKLSIEKVTELYVTQNMSRKDTAKKLGVSLSTLARFITDNDIQKDNSKIVELREQTMMDRYGVKHALDSDEFKEKAKQTCRENHGVDYPMQSDEVMAKSRATSKDHWGTEHPRQSEEYWESYWAEHPREEKQRYSDLSEEEKALVQAERQERRKQTTLERYGVENPSQVPEIRAKAKETTRERYGDDEFFRTETFRERSVITSRKRYGTDNPMQSETIKAKARKTTRDRYGSDCSLQNPDVHAKSMKTNLEKYGNEHPMKTEEIKQKLRNTLLDRYGVDNPSKVNEFKEKRRATSLERYGVADYNKKDIKHLNEWEDKDLFIGVCKQLETELNRKPRISDLMDYFNVGINSAYTKAHTFECSDLINNSTSYIENKWRSWLKSENISCSDRPVRILFPEGKRNPQEIDIYIPEYNLGIEIDPTYTHNSTLPCFHTTQPKSQLYHQQKSLLAERQGINLIHIYDFTDEDKMKSIIRSLCHLNDRIYARNTTCKPVDVKTEKKFLEENHLQGYVKSEKAYGLFSKNEDRDLLAIMTFGDPRYGAADERDIEWEMLRFCSKSGLTVVGGASKLFSAFVKESSPASILSYADFDISNGNMYEKLGFEYKRMTNPSYTWTNLDNPTDTYSWYVVKAKGFDNLFGTHHGKSKSNRQLMEEAGYVQVFNSGNKVYIWTAPETD